MPRVGEEIFEFSLNDISGANFDFLKTNTDLSGKTIILSFIDIVSPRDWWWLKWLEENVPGDSNLKKISVIYNPSGAQDLNWPTTPPPFPSTYGPTVDSTWIDAKRIHYAVDPADGNSIWLLIPDGSGTPASDYVGGFGAALKSPGIFLIRPNDFKLTDTIHFDSADNGSGAVGSSMSLNDLIVFNWANVSDPGGTAPEGMSLNDYRKLDKILRFIVKRRNDLLNTSRIVQVSSPNVTNGNAWVTDGTVLTFSFHSKDGLNYIPKKAIGAWDTEHYLLGTESGNFQLVSPSQLNVSDYLNETGGAETKSVTLNSDISDHVGQTPAFSPDATSILDSTGQAFAFETSAPTFEVLDDQPVLYFRDNLDVDKGYPHNGALSCSPDIILNGDSQLANPQILEDPNYTLYVPAEYGSDNYLYLRAFNRGAAPTGAGDFKGTVYWADGSTLSTPADWHLIGSADFGVIEAAREQIRVAPVITWNHADISPVGHHCSIGTIVNTLAGETPDSFKNSLTITTIDEYYSLVHSEHRVTWRNFNVINDDPDSPPPVPPQPAPNPLPEHRQLPFFFPGLPGKNAKFQLQVIQRLPFDVPIQIDLSDDMLKQMPGWQDMKHKKIDKQARFEAKSKEVKLFPKVHELSSFKKKPIVWIQVPRIKKPYKGMYSLVVRQLWEGKEVGRITWVFKSSKGNVLPGYHKMYRWQEAMLAKKQKMGGKKAK